MNEETKLWRYNRITGYWIFERNVSTETAEKWLSRFRKCNPGEFFKVSKKQPIGVPNET